MAPLIFFLFILPSIGFSFDTTKYNLPAPSGWTEQSGLFGSDVVFTTPIVGQEIPLTLYLKTLPAKLDSNIHEFLKKDLAQYAQRKGMKYTLKSEKTLAGSNAKIYYIEANILDEEKTEKLLIAIPHDTEYIYGHYDGPSTLYHRHRGELLGALKSFRFK